MNLVDAAIIYFACGAPAAVFHFFDQRGEGRGRKVRQSLLVFLAWPLYLVRLLREKTLQIGSQQYSSGTGSPDSVREEKLRRIRSALEREVSLGPEYRSGRIRDAFERYCGLADAVRESGRNPIVESPIYTVSGHENTELATLCLMRRNRTRLIRHHNSAREELLRMFVNGNGPDSNGNTPEELFRLMDDQEGLSILKERPQILTAPNVQSLGNEVWSSQAAKASAARHI